MEQNLSIGFIGCGQMAACLIGGLMHAGYPNDKVGIFDVCADKAAALSTEYGLSVCHTADALVSHRDVVVLCVKPQNMKALILSIKPSVWTKKPLLISVAAGIQVAHIEKWLAAACSIVRVMPNTAALLKSGAAGLYANAAVTPLQRNVAEALLRSVGITVWLEEEALMDPLTALSGSGPAYFFYLMEALIATGIQLGLSTQDATLLVVQTAMGAAKMALESTQSPTQLREQVTSKGGTTEAALAVLMEGNFTGLIEKALQRSCKRSIELGKLLGQ